MMRFVSILALAGAFAAPSLLQAAPSGQQGAGDNVIVITPAKVDVPSSLPGACTVRGVVQAIWQGAAYRVGQHVALQVPCSNTAPVVDYWLSAKNPGGRGSSRPEASSLNALELAASPLGYAHVDDQGRLIWTPSGRSWGDLGRIAGYEMRGAKLPLSRSAA